MAYSNGQSHHRLPGFAHFESPFSLSSGSHTTTSSSLDPVVFKFSCTDTLGDGPIASTAGLDLSIVNGLDLSSSNYEGLNLSNNAGDRNGSNNHSSHSSNQANMKNQPNMTSNVNQQNSNYGQSQGIVNESEMVLNLSTQIGLNLTRPGHELDYSDMLNIDQQSTFNTALQDNDFDYYPDYYTSYTDPLMEQQRNSPLNLEHRSSPLNLTAVGTIGRKRRSTANFNQYNQGQEVISNFIPNQNTSFHNPVLQNNGNHQIKSGKYMNTIDQLQNAPMQQQFSSTAAQSTSSNNYTPTATMSQQFPINHSLNGSQLSSNSFSSSLSSQLPSGASLASTSAQAATMSMGEAAASTSSVAQTVPLNMEKSQNLVQDFSFNNQAFDYRLPNKLTSFYNHQSQENENCLNGAGSTNMFSNQKSNLSNQGDGLKQGSKLKVTAVKDPEYDISFSYIDNYNDEGPFTSNQTDAFEINTNYVDMNTSEQGPSNYRQPELNKSNSRKETIKTSVDLKKYSCDVCSQSFTDESKLNIHKKSEHRTSPLKGQSTFDNFISNDPVNLSPMKNRVSDLNTSDLNRYVKPIEKSITSPLKPKKIYKCNVCNDSFTYQSACKRHEKLHVDLKPFSCDKCDKRFSRSFDLKNHVKMHNDLDKSKCSKCKVNVTSEGAEHDCIKQLEPRPPKYPCPICPRSLNSKREWGAHMWKHTGESRYIVLSEDKELPKYIPKKPK